MSCEATCESLKKTDICHFVMGKTCVPFDLSKKFPPYEMFLTLITCTNFEPSCNSLPWKVLVNAARNKSPFGGGGELSIELL